MCTQYYSSFTQCPCQLKRLFWRCKHGRASPKCKSVQKVVLKSGEPLCWYHEIVHQCRRDRSKRLWRRNTRNLWCSYEPRPLCRQSVSSAAAADESLFPPPDDPYDSSCWESEPDPDPEDEEESECECELDSSSGCEYSGEESISEMD
ncbi:hypothetical protein F5Y00DRAFT_257432 [Daldinia vernicosa]|uniref:uncharacterized protein n=1 Tax=Daldinia vernicosa TaxID=114800 RepID=UPI0020087D21|nr:uncharacterized protein F5Y00DRAFT_257432 [Daldinia vernicosa]KAI0853409.1 hypothetical protein F5Y00DRAFT_257432 [Daldinia vernicosa]